MIVTLINQTVTASGTSLGQYIPVQSADIVLQLNVSAVSGTTPTLTVKVQESLDGINFSDLATFTQATAVSTQVLKEANPSSVLRVSYTVGGTTPSFGVEVLALPKKR